METYRNLRTRLGPWQANLLLTAFFCVWLLPAFFRTATEWAERLSLDAAQMAFSPFRSPDPRLMMINIDTATLQAVPHRWPWPRSEYHRLCQRLLAADPRFLVIDILFQHLEGDKPSEGDLALAELFRRSGRVGLISVVEETPSPEGLQLRHFRSDKLFREAAVLDGFVWGQYDVDHTIRSVTLADERLGAQSCAIQTARHLNPQLPLPRPDAHGLIRGQLAFLRGQGGIPSVSALDVLEGRVATETLKDRILFLGVTADILHDWHKSPLGVISGLEILTTSLDSLLHRRLVSRVDTFWARLAAILIGGFLGLFLVRSGGRTSLVRSIAAAAGIWGLLLLQSTLSGVHPPVAPLILAWVFCSVCWVVTLDTLAFVDLQLARAEAEAAGKIQANLFPSSEWIHESYVCRGKCIPWEAAGGDLFDIISLPDGRLLCLVLDVAGHGFGAAMVTVMAKTVSALLEQKRELTPESLIEQINAVVFRFLKKKKHMTGVFALLTPDTGEVQLISAGHLPSYLVRRNGEIEEMGKPGFPLGMRQNLKVTEQRMTMNPGDTLVLYTDGIVEAVNWQNEQLGFDRWREALRDLLTTSFDQDIFNRAVSIIQRHTRQRPFQDDVTLLFLHRLPSS